MKAKALQHWYVNLLLRAGNFSILFSFSFLLIDRENDDQERDQDQVEESDDQDRHAVDQAEVGDRADFREAQGEEAG